MKKLLLLIYLTLWASITLAQDDNNSTTGTYKKRVLESTEVELLGSYYGQTGNNAAVTGGLGTEELKDLASTIIVKLPLNDDDVLSINAGISAYSSASSSNINPFDGKSEADPFQASSGASSSDVWVNFTGIYSHSSDDRNSIWTGKASVSTEYDYTSFGLGGSYTRLMNEKNTEVSINGNVYLDQWSLIYPIELRPFVRGGDGIRHSFFEHYNLQGNSNYWPKFTGLDNSSRNSYSVGVSISQILSKNLQGVFMVDGILQEGLLSTPFQRVYFQDYEDSFIQNFHLADDVERLPSTRQKLAIGGRLNYFINELLVLRSYYRYYLDSWNIKSQTVNLELPVKLSPSWTIYPSYRHYWQSAASYFAPYNEHLSTASYYTSDYDLSKFNAGQFGIGISYTDIFTHFHIWRFGLKSVDLKFNSYERNTGLKANITTFGIKFTEDKPLGK